MTHEFKQIVEEYGKAAEQGLKSVLATVVALDGSSYRRPGVRMLLLENGTMVGAVSGGCVEKEVFRQAESVFKSGTPKVMTYDGRYRLGCEGVLYILLEPMNFNDKVLATFWSVMKNREPFAIKSFFQKDFVENQGFGSKLILGDNEYAFREGFDIDYKLSVFQQEMQACFRLIVIGAEHDTVQLCTIATAIGWEVTVVVNPREEKRLKDFPGAIELIADEGDTLELELDSETAVVLMTHSYVKDLKYLEALKNQKPIYFGLLGPARRREKLFNEFIERHPEVDPDFIENIHGPAGLDIGAETPQEIALSILTEVIAVVNQKNVNSLKDKEGKIHA